MWSVGGWRKVDSAASAPFLKESGTVRARMKKEMPEKDWKPWTFPLQWLKSGLRKCRWFLPLQPTLKTDPVNGVQEVAGSNPVAPTMQGLT